MSKYVDKFKSHLSSNKSDADSPHVDSHSQHQHGSSSSGSTKKEKAPVPTWETHAIKSPVKSHWRAKGGGPVRLSPAMMQSLWMGFTPRDMDDRWVIWTEQVRGVSQGGSHDHGGGRGRGGHEAGRGRGGYDAGGRGRGDGRGGHPGGESGHGRGDGHSRGGGGRGGHEGGSHVGYDRGGHRGGRGGGSGHDHSGHGMGGHQGGRHGAHEHEHHGRGGHDHHGRGGHDHGGRGSHQPSGSSHAHHSPNKECIKTTLARSWTSDIVYELNIEIVSGSVAQLAAGNAKDVPGILKEVVWDKSVCQEGEDEAQARMWGIVNGLLGRK